MRFKIIFQLIKELLKYILILPFLFFNVYADNTGATKIIQGTIIYNNAPVSNYTTAIAKLIRFYDANTNANVNVNFQYNNGTGQFTISNVPPGVYRLSLYIDAAMPFGELSPGDYNDSWSGMNGNIGVPNNVNVIQYNHNVKYNIHLKNPIDLSNYKINTTSALPEVYQSSKSPSAEIFEWYPVPGATSYQLYFMLFEGNPQNAVNAKRVDLKEYKISQTTIKPNLQTAVGNRYWSVDISAFNAGNKKIGSLTYFYNDGFGEGWLFRVKPVDSYVGNNQSNKPILFEAIACLQIGNIQGQGPVICEGEGGRNFGKAGKSFLHEDNIFILLRFRNLNTGNHTLRTRVYLYNNNLHRYEWQKQYDKTYQFINSQKSWAYWFPATARESGQWKIEVFLDNWPWFGKDVDYCVNCAMD